MKMYIPPKFSVKEKEDELKFLERYPFATLISNTDGELEFSKIPLILKQEEDGLYLEGHLSKANPHWKAIQQNSHLTLLFDGAHGYVSPTWYTDPTTQVPTWNYSTVLVEAECLIIEETGWIVSSLIELSGRFEKDKRWINSVKKEYFKERTPAVVGLRAKVKSLKSKFKLSQNRVQEDQKRVISVFEEINKELAEDMRKCQK